MDRAHADWLHYRSEAALAMRLDDRERSAAIRELFDLYLAFQRGKSPEQIIREIRADWTLNPVRLNPRYLKLRDQAFDTAGGLDEPAHSH